MPTPTDAADVMTDERMAEFDRLFRIRRTIRDSGVNAVSNDDDHWLSEFKSQAGNSFYDMEHELYAALTAARAEVERLRAIAELAAKMPEPINDSDEMMCGDCALCSGEYHYDRDKHSFTDLTHDADCPWVLLQSALATPSVPAAAERPQSHSADAKRGLTDRPTVPNDSGQ